jgi:hypothetical protein
MLGQGIAAIVIAFVFLPFIRHGQFRRKKTVKPLELEDPSIESIN